MALIVDPPARVEHLAENIHLKIEGDRQESSCR